MKNKAQTTNENPNTKQLKTLSISFKHELWGQEIGRWRGAFLEMAGWQEDLCHNHKSKDGYYYRYPLVQYRVQRGNAGLFAVNEGVDALQRVLATSDWELNWKGEKRTLTVEDLHLDEHYLRFLTQPRTYRLRHWMALNPENFRKWDAMRSVIPKMQMLQKLLENHTMATLWGVGFEPTERVEVALLDIDRKRTVTYHGTSLVAFDVVFESNVLLPRGLGFGKAVSHGFGALELLRVPAPTQANEVRMLRNDLVQ